MHEILPIRFLEYCFVIQCNKQFLYFTGSGWSNLERYNISYILFYLNILLTDLLGSPDIV